MFRDEFELGGPVMYAVLAVWILVLALVLERVLFWFGYRLRRGSVAVRRRPEVLLAQAEHNLSRIDGLSQLATSLGLFGTVLGISRAFFSRGSDLTLAAPEILASGMATALFTTVAGLVVFLFGQGALIVFQWWTDTAVTRIRQQPGGREGR